MTVFYSPAPVLWPSAWLVSPIEKILYIWLIEVVAKFVENPLYIMVWSEWAVIAVRHSWDLHRLIKFLSWARKYSCGGKIPKGHMKIKGVIINTCDYMHSLQLEILSLSHLKTWWMNWTNQYEQTSAKKLARISVSTVQSNHCHHRVPSGHQEARATLKQSVPRCFRGSRVLPHR